MSEPSRRRARSTRVLCHVRHMLSTELAVTIGCSIVASRLDYCNSLLYGAPSMSLDRLQRSQDMLARVVTQSSSRNSASSVAVVSRYTGCQSASASIRLQSRHSDVQGSSDVIAAVPEFTAEQPRPVTDSQTFQHAASDRSKNAYRTCQVLRRCSCSMEQSAGRRR